MMYEKYSQLELITPRMLSNTVLCDERTCLWFRKLFSLTPVLERLKGSPEGQQIWGRYRMNSFAAAAFAVLSVGLFLAGRLFFQQFFVGLGVSAAVAAAGCGFFLRRGRRDLAALAAQLITLDRALIPPGTTLFQLGEIYARQYGVPSLVDVIWIWDQSLRNVFLLLFTVTLGVLFLPDWGMAIGCIAGCAVTACLVKIWVMGRRT